MTYKVTSYVSVGKPEMGDELPSFRYHTEDGSILNSSGETAYIYGEEALKSIVDIHPARNTITDEIIEGYIILGILQKKNSMV